MVWPCLNNLLIKKNPFNNNRIGIPYVRSKTDERSYPEIWEEFWEYFQNTWLVMYDPSSWNINGCLDTDTYKLDEEEILINRTNNPIERYNKRLNEKFGVGNGKGRPSMAQFVTTIRDEASHYLMAISDMSRGRAVKAGTKSGHKDPTIQEMPLDYATFRVKPPAKSRKPNEASKTGGGAALKLLQEKTPVTATCSRCFKVGHYARQCTHAEKRK